MPASKYKNTVFVKGPHHLVLRLLSTTFSGTSLLKYSPVQAYMLMEGSSDMSGRRRSNSENCTEFPFCTSSMASKKYWNPGISLTTFTVHSATSLQ